MPSPPSDRADRQAQPVYPVFLTDLAAWTVVVVGGGTVATRKIAGLLAAQARVTVIAPAITPQIEAWRGEGHVDWIARPYAPGDLTGARLVIAATDSRTVNVAVAQDVAAHGALCNVADNPDLGNFHVPAVHRDADYTLAVGTGGASPRRAVALRDRLAAYLAHAETEEISRKVAKTPREEKRGWVSFLAFGSE